MSVSAPSDYVDLQVVTDANQLADDAIAYLQTIWPDWEPNEGDQESIMVEALAPMAANAANVASQMPPEALYALGTNLYNLPPYLATAAVTTVTFTAQDNAGYDIPAGSEINIDGYAFATSADVSIPGSAPAVTGVQVVCETAGADANGLTGVVTAPISTPIQITGITVEAATADGADDEDPNAYLSRFSRAVRLRAKTLVTPTDYEIEATEQPNIGRAHADVNATTKTMTVTVTALDGTAAASADKTALLADLSTYRCSNWTVAVANPTYTAVSVTWAATALPGYDHTDLQSRINSQLAGVLSPTGYGQLWGGSTGSDWWNEPTIAINQIIALIGGVQGVQVCTSVHLNGSTSDLVMSGTVPLPTPGTISGTVS
jgi:Baseplate J-like protein